MAIGNHIPVWTTEGIKRHGEIRSGDFVFDDTGNPVEVHDVSGPVECRWDVSSMSGRKRYDSIICSDDQVFDVYLDKQPPIFELVDVAGLLHFMSLTKNIVRVDHPPVLNFPKRKELFPHPYFMGLWLGDGDANAPAVFLHEEQCEPAQFIQDTLGYNCTKPVKTKSGKCKEFYFNKYGEISLRGALTDTGVLNNKHIPKEYMTGSLEQRSWLLAGLIDSDGSYDPKNKVYRFSNTNLELANRAYELAVTLGLKPSCFAIPPSKVEKHASWKDSKYRSKVIVGFRSRIYIPCQVPCKKGTDAGPHYRRYSIRSVEPCKKVGKGLFFKKKYQRYLVTRFNRCVLSG